ncbi:MAG: glucosyltransferase domain-containing protein [Burkholderiaceae bacterium]|nr:glucosyltransferase domain-containing protein [Burkholderiaceae bacterium]
MFLTRKEGHTAGILFALFCLLNAYQLTNFNVSIDDEFLYQSSVCHFADLGRWMHPLLGVTLWPQPITPTARLLIFGVLFAVSFIYVLRLFRIERISGFTLVVFSAYATYPVWLAQLAFSANVLPVGIGVFCATWAALRTATAGDAGWRSRTFWLRGVLPAALACAVAQGAYQSLGLMYLVIVLAAGLAMQQRAETISLGRLMVIAVVTLVIGMAISSVVGRLVMIGCGVGFSAYGQQFFRLETWLHNPWRPIQAVYKDWGAMYYRDWRHIGMAGVTFCAAVLISLFVCVRFSPSGQRVKRAFWLLALTFLPALLALVSGDRLPLRTFLAAATVLCCLFFLAHSVCLSLTLYRRVVAALAILTVVQGLYVNSVAQARGWAVARHDQALAAAIYAELVRQNGGGGAAQHPIKVNFSGMRAFGAEVADGCAFLKRYYPTAPSTTTGASFFAWDGGHIGRIVSYMNLLGYTDLQIFIPQPLEAAHAAYTAMPSWPAPGSVARFGEGFIIKLSPPMNNPFAMCGG